MSQNTQHDSLLLENLYLSYDKSLSPLNEKPRIVSGSNSLVTFGGALMKRPGVTFTMGASSRIDRLWEYDTIETEPNTYIIASLFNSGTNKWFLAYRKLGVGYGVFTNFTSAGSLRDIDASTRPHEVVVHGGFAYVKSYPDSSSAEKLGTVILDGTGGSISVKPWGIMGPTVPARIDAQVTKTSAAINNSTTSLPVSANFTSPPATPFIIYVTEPGVSEEYMIVTTGGASPWTVTRSATPMAHSANARVFYRENWGTSNHLVDVITGWSYTYAYKTITGHVSNRAPLETNLDLAPSNTFPFFDKCPKVIVQGHSDTTNVPTIVIFRSTDGGGTYYKLEEITNTGSGNITYIDDSLGTGASGTTFQDPLPDEVLDQGSRAPGLDTNGPPITVVAPLVVGTDTPQKSSPIASYAGRLFVCVGPYLLYSSKNEITMGNPEEAWPVGADGNSEKLKSAGINLVTGKNGLYVFTANQVYKLTGTTKETFQLRPILEDIGIISGKVNNPMAACRVGDNIVFVSNDYRVLQLDENDKVTILSEPIFSELKSFLLQNNDPKPVIKVELVYFTDQEKEWLVLQTAYNQASTIENAQVARQWVLDLALYKKSNQLIWNTPWTVNATTLYSGKLYSTGQDKYLSFASWSGSGASINRILFTSTSVLDQYLVSVVSGNILTTQYPFEINTNLYKAPTGNHVNALRNPDLTPIFQKVVIERALFGGEPDPDVYFYFDDYLTNPVNVLTDEEHAIRNPSKFYKTMTFYGQQAAYRTGLKIYSNSGDPLTLYTINLVWNPDQGA